jgi:hypothetical protein
MYLNTCPNEHEQTVFTTPWSSFHCFFLLYHLVIAKVIRPYHQEVDRRMGMVAHACNPSYSRGRRSGFQASPSKKFSRPHLNK